ncbi:MAG: hypothetical protein LQ342_003171 [Letrouitia transgressa]|nr:MAG: hypothetical protein LQ342_003171 [Letrouitia transgressa]
MLGYLIFTNVQAKTENRSPMVILQKLRLLEESSVEGEEVLHLPVIVEAAESSPNAAREAADRIRKFLSRDNYQRAYVQYNAIMLVRILADNPGQTFTRNLDSRFTVTVKYLLRDGRDMSVQQILRETLDSFESSKANDETLASLCEMWKKEKARYSKTGNNIHPQLRTPNAPPYNPNQTNYFARDHRPRGLPAPHELAQRIEEAKTSAKLLQQVVQSTPPREVLGNELIKEFVERCQSASRSIQGYINSDNPPPDEDTLQTLIETNDQISTSMSVYQRAMLQARRVTGISPLPTPPVESQRHNSTLEMPGNGIAVNGTYHSSSTPQPISTFSSLANPPTASAHPPTSTFSSLANPSTSPPSSPHSNKPIFSHPPSPPHRRASDQDPFDDHHEAPESMQAPSNFGLPPKPPQSGYRARYSDQQTQSYHEDYNDSRQLHGTMATKHDTDSEEEEEYHGRGNRQYRF